jgi:hypothetical protein
LLLRHWNHPLADDADFRAALLESAAEVLRSSAAGEVIFADLEPENVNFVAAVWRAESVSLSSAGEVASDERAQREKWLDSLLKSIPSCFCNPNELD